MPGHLQILRVGQYTGGGLPAQFIKKGGRMAECSGQPATPPTKLSAIMSISKLPSAARYWIMRRSRQSVWTFLWTCREFHIQISGLHIVGSFILTSGIGGMYIGRWGGRLLAYRQALHRVHRPAQAESNGWQVIGRRPQSPFPAPLPRN